MTIKQVLFRAVNDVALVDVAFDEGDLGPLGMAIKTRFSVISAGTEVANLVGLEPSLAFPWPPGYGSIGEVIAVREGVTGVKPGDRVFTYGRHQSYDQARLMAVPVPEGLPGEQAVLARMAAVAMTAVRASQAELGDWAAVFGLGTVGNFAAQLLRLSGCEVIGVDLSPLRLERAQACGVQHTINVAEQKVRETVTDLTGGRMCEVVVEASGSPQAAPEALAIAGKLGEVILVGSPRAEYQTNLTPVLQQVHLWQNGCVTLKGAHEWRYPTRRDPGQWIKHSIERNVEIILGLMADGRLRTQELLTHLVSPADCAEAYAGLRDKKDEYLGVVFDWGRA